MDRKEIKSIWSAWQEVQEKKAPVTKKDDDGEGMDPVGKADGDIDNDGDKDSSDEYLANRRKTIGKAMKKEEVEEDKSQFMYAAKQAKKKGDQEFVFAGKKYKTEDAYNMKEEDYPVPPKTKKPGDAMEPVNNRTAKLKEGKKVECPKCEGKGCDHCDDKGYHMSEGESDGPYPSPEKKKKPGDALEPVNNRTAKLKESELFSEAELAELEEKAKHVGTKGPEPTAPEEFMSTSSASEKKTFADHEAGSDKKIEDYEEMGEMDGANAGKAVKTQSSGRRGDNLKVGDNAMPTPMKAKGQ
jgi:hypothetical protein